MSVGDSDEFEFSPSGKTTKRYGPTTYRFSAALTFGVLLPRRGWTVVKKAKNYVYLTPRSKHTAPPFRISIAVPSPEIARRRYAKGNHGWASWRNGLPGIFTKGMPTFWDVARLDNRANGIFPSSARRAKLIACMP